MATGNRVCRSASCASSAGRPRRSRRCRRRSFAASLRGGRAVMKTGETRAHDSEALPRLRAAFDLAWAKLPRGKRSADSKRALAEAVMQVAEQGEIEPLR